MSPTSPQQGGNISVVMEFGKWQDTTHSEQTFACANLLRICYW